MKGTAVAEIRAAIEPTIVALGYELVGCVYVPKPQRSLLRIYIDSPRGIMVADCERVSRQVSAVLDVEDLIAGSYALEVSSPGLDRPLFTKAHYERFKGARVHIQLHVPLDGRRNFTGFLQDVVGEKIVVKVDEEILDFPLDNIAKANLLPELQSKSRGSKS